MQSVNQQVGPILRANYICQKTKVLACDSTYQNKTKIKNDEIVFGAPYSSF